MPSPAPLPRLPVPLAAPAREYQRLRREIESAIQAVLVSGRYVRGPAIERFESQWSEALGGGQTVLFGSGTAALEASLRAAGVGPGDEVVVPAFTFVADGEAPLALGAVPVAADVDPRTLLLDVEAAVRAFTPRTRAVVAVHLFGQPHGGLEALAAAARARGIVLIEDACQAHGAVRADRPPEAQGELLCFSFYPTKNLGTCGECGAAVAREPGLVERLRALRDHGVLPGDSAGGPGLNLWPSEIEAAVLSAKLPRLAEANAQRRDLARRYDRLLAEHPGARPLFNAAGDAHVYHQYVLRSPRRDALRELIERAGVETAVHYPQALPDLPALAGRVRAADDCPNAREAAREVLSLPVHPGLTSDEARRCLDALSEALDRRRGSAAVRASE